MMILFDQGVPAPLRNSLTSHKVSTAYELGWDKLKNGELIAIAEEKNFNVLISTDQNLSISRIFREEKLPS